MATWKRICTEDDVSSVNISNTELTTTASGRSLSLYSGTSSNFTIKGRMQDSGSSSAYFNAMYVRAQNNSFYTNKENNYVFFPTLRVGKPGQVGTAGNNGYKFPSVDAGVTDGELMVTKSFNASTGQLDFLTFGQWMKPTGDGIKATAATSDGYFGITGGNAPDLDNDSVLVMDDTNDEFAHHKLINMPRSITIDFSNSTFNFNSSAAGELFLRSGGYLQGGTGVSNGGVVVTSDCTLHKVGFRYKKEHSAAVDRFFRVYKNNTLVYTTAGSGSLNGINTVVRDVATPGTNGTIASGQTLSFSAGDEVDVSSFQSSSGNGQYLQVTLEFITNA